MPLKHRAAPGFWSAYHALPPGIRLRADRQFSLLQNRRTTPVPKIFKKLDDRRGREIWSARITLDYRALAHKLPDTYLWFWIGPHEIYNALIS